MKTISIIVPAYNAEKTLGKCLESIIKQTYRNLEIIVVNDGSTDSTKEIAVRMTGVDERIKVVNHEKNCGLFRARLTGVKASSGEYIGFVDSDDYISLDYYRNLIEKAETSEADIVVGKIVQEDESGYQWIQNIYEDFDFGSLADEEIMRAYWEQEGHNFIWHTIWNKIYSRHIWMNALSVLDSQKEHLVMCEDFVFSSVLFFFAKKLECVRYGRYFYYRNSDASTALNDDVRKYRKNINDIILSFRFVCDFLKNNEVDSVILAHYDRWEGLYKYFWTQNVFNSHLAERDKVSLVTLLNNSLFSNTIPRFPNYFYSASTQFDSRYEDIVNLIASDSVKVISFDIFDTALMRPFYKPTDLFLFLNERFRELDPDSRIVFSKIREDAEKVVRKEKIYDSDNPAEDISIDDIYEEIFTLISVDKKLLNKMKKEELLLEEKFLARRESIYNIYKMALFIGKKVIFTSDMYIDSKHLNRILSKNGYTQFEKIYVSCELNASKRTGALYDRILEEFDIQGSELLHIGDNWQSDIVKAGERKIIAKFYPNTIECLKYGISDIKSTHAVCGYDGRNNSLINFEKSLSYLGNRCAIAVVANNLYDMPFYSYNEWSESNASPQFFGRLALGMHLLGVTKWIADESQKTDYDRFIFIARDGYLPMKAFELYSNYCNVTVDKIDYFYTSRKAGLLCGVNKYEDLLSLYEMLDAIHLTGKDLVKVFEPVLDLKSCSDIDKVLLSLEIKSFDEYCSFVKNVLADCFDTNKAEAYNTSLKKYFDTVFAEKSVLVDIGYSGRTQEMIYRVTGKNVDGLYIHKNDDVCSRREAEFGFKIHSFYDFTPSITGAQRELLFSALQPSCIGYEVSGDEARPIFEYLDTDYPMKYLIDEIQGAALDFVKDYCSTFGNYIKIMNMRNIEISYPFEHMLAYLQQEDLKIFDCVLFEDDMWAGGTISLTDQWKEAINYHRLMQHQRSVSQQQTICREILPHKVNYAWELYNQKGMERKNIIAKIFFWLVNDTSFLKVRLKEYIGRK